MNINPFNFGRLIPSFQISPMASLSLLSSSFTQSKLCFGLLMTGIGLSLFFTRMTKMFRFGSKKTKYILNSQSDSEVKNTVIEIQKIYEKYINDPSYVYQMCTDKKSNFIRWIVILQKLSDTITNEYFDEKNVQYLHLKHLFLKKYRADKLRIIKIFDSDHPTITTDTISHTCNGKTVVYTINSDIQSDAIHYFKLIEGAYYYGLPHSKYTGEWFSHTDDGYLHLSGNYIKGHKDGIWTYWFIDQNNEKTEQNMIPHRKITFTDGRQNGKYIEYHDGSLNKSVEYTTHESIIVNTYTSWFHNGNIHIEGEYDHHGQKCGEWNYYDMDGNSINKIMYSTV